MDVSIGICDNEKVYLAQIEKIIDSHRQKSKINYHIYKFNSGEQLLNSHTQLDILFLDIEMNDMNGIDVKENLNRTYSNCKIIFVSNYENRMKDAFGKNVIAFIAKQNLNSITDCLIQLEKEGTEHFLMKLGHCQLDLYDIIYIKADGSYVNIYTKSKSYTCSIYLADVIDRLNDYPFIKIHRSYVVNLRYIKNIEKELLVLSTGEKLPISRRNQKVVLESYYEYVRGIF